MLTVAQLFIGEEMLIDTAIAVVVLAAVLAGQPAAGRYPAGSAPRWPDWPPRRASPCCWAAYALWVQFHGAIMHGGGATTVISYRGQLVHIYALPYAFVTPSGALLLHTSGTAAAAARYPQPQAEYLAYLGWPLIIVLIAAAIIFWRQLAVRVTALTVAVLELFSLGGQPVVFHGIHYPAALLPWYWLQHLPAVSSALPDRLAILADGAAGAALAFSLDLARSRAPRAGRWRYGAAAATAVAVSRSCR